MAGGTKTGIAALTVLAMLAFAANSLLARLALADGEASATGYTGIRLVAGATMLGVLVGLGGRRKSEAGIAGSWAGALALCCYALAFSIAYLVVGAGTGALILFSSVQFGMLAWAVARGDRPGALEWLGMGVALAALALLVAPGLVAPPPMGVALMVVAGLAWAAYSLIGRGSQAPLADTAGNFIRSVPVGLVLVAIGDLPHMSTAGLFYAVLSGAIASGLGYAIWYTALPHLTRSSAAFVQLTVPAIAASGGVLLLGEPVTPRLLVASAGILGGVALAVVTAERRRRVAAAP